MSAEHEMVRYDRMRHITAHISRIRFLNEHMHGSFEISYVLEGSAKYCSGKNSRTVRPGSLILANPYEPHSYAPQENKPFVLLTVHIHKLFARRYIENIPRLAFDTQQITELSQSQQDTLIRLLFQTAIAYFDNQNSQQFDVIGNATLLLGRLVAYLNWELESNSDSSDKELQKNRVQRLVNYIDENYRQKITLSKLAEMEGISTTYLSHFFHKAFGVSFQHYLSSQRFEKALVLMHDKSISMVDICMNCGFSDNRYLEAACQRTFGCSVAEYRKRCETQDDSGIKQSGYMLQEYYSRKESLKLLKAQFSEERAEALA